MADCGVIHRTRNAVDQLADIAVSTGQLARQILGTRPRVALLSFSTKGSATHPSISLRVEVCPRWPKKRRKNKKSKPILTANCKWTPRADSRNRRPQTAGKLRSAGNAAPS